MKPTFTVLLFGFAVAIATEKILSAQNTERVDSIVQKALELAQQASATTQADSNQAGNNIGKSLVNPFAHRQQSPAQANPESSPLASESRPSVDVQDDKIRIQVNGRNIEVPRNTNAAPAQQQGAATARSWSSLDVNGLLESAFGKWNGQSIGPKDSNSRRLVGICGRFGRVQKWGLSIGKDGV
ncbi:MAG: hypothetical protein R3C03_16845 [Pirellulaceae bacterium]